MSFAFPYKFRKFDNVVIPYPEVTVSLKTFNGNQQFSFILDTGADITTMPSYMIQVLQIDPTKLAKSYSHGINSDPVSTRNASVIATIGATTFQLPVSFIDNNSLPFLLGKEGLFDQFNIVFDNDRKETILHVR